MEAKRLSVQYVKLAVKHIVDRREISKEQKKVIDKDKDGIVSIDDVISLTRNVLDVGNPPPSVAQKTTIHASLIYLAAHTNLTPEHKLIIGNTIRHTDPKRNAPNFIKNKTARYRK